MVDLAAVMAEHRANVGWREGPQNQNPWGPEQGVGPNLAYCDSGCSMVPWHHGLRWWPDCTFHDRGCAYTVAHVAVARTHGKYVDDHASKGNPAPLAEGQPAFFDWNGSGSVDHVETIAELPQGPLGYRFVTIGYNTGNPGGCWRMLRDRKYLHGTIVMDEYYNVPAPAPTPTPTPTPVPTEDEDMMDLVTCIPARENELPAEIRGGAWWFVTASQRAWCPTIPNAKQAFDQGLTRRPWPIEVSPTWILEKRPMSPVDANFGLAKVTDKGRFPPESFPH